MFSQEPGRGAAHFRKVQALPTEHMGAPEMGRQVGAEVEPDTVSNWAAVPAYRRALEQTLGAGALERLRDDAEFAMSSFGDNAEKLYRNFMAAIP